MAGCREPGIIEFAEQGIAQSAPDVPCSLPQEALHRDFLRRSPTTLVHGAAHPPRCGSDGSCDAAFI
ncbi:hypothetical protein Cenrod_2533 [Candidatus Symbiobacter mobilis CR]|uniref:Uncharacterized protein n=1 Tax=Candidatus Symbiobacter mobilis CR TaxID=946483 RepID=U5NAZ0_9BURK|nr:hypothetical protein Cenrod_2533 [Candidatus Symbiobacter mobilis CR]